MTTQPAPTHRIEWCGNIKVYVPIKQLPRTWCGLYLCCRERNHIGSCEVDMTMLSDAELEAIEASRAVA